MRVTNELILETVNDVVGEDVLPVVKFLKDRKNISEFKIAEKLDIEVNRIRNMLYRLYTHNLAVYNRKKDRQKGWYISYWTFNHKGLKHLVTKLNHSRLSKLKERLYKEESNKDNFYLCPNMCARLDFDQATEFEYKCPECGQILNQQDNTKSIENLKKRIKDMEKQKT